MRLASQARWHEDESKRLFRAKLTKRARREDQRAQVLRTAIKIRKEIRECKS